MLFALFAYRYTPKLGLEYCLARLPMSRRLQTMTSLLSPNVTHGEHNYLLVRQQRWRRYHDKGIKALPLLHIDVTLALQQQCTRSPSIVKEELTWDQAQFSFRFVENLIQTFYETSAAHFFVWLKYAESANQNYFRFLFFWACKFFVSGKTVD